jgi:Domain of unknown function (DUF4365)
MTLNQRKAAVGESATEVVLKPLAQVSSPVRLSEYAIDYICRLYKENKPSNNIFLVEVKTAIDFSSKWRREISRETIKFWLSQSYPVYIVTYDFQNDVCYWISVEDNRENWTKKLEKKINRISIRIDFSHVLKKAPDPNDDFLKKIEEDSIRLKIFNGIPQILYLGEKKEKGVFHFKYPDLDDLSDSTRKKFKNNIRYSLFLLVRDGLSKDLQEAYKLSRILTEYDTCHYENFELRADVCVKLKMEEEARDYYNKAINCLKRDPNWDNDRPPEEKSRAELISEIEIKLAEIPPNQCNQN